MMKKKIKKEKLGKKYVKDITVSLKKKKQKTKKGPRKISKFYRRKKKQRQYYWECNKNLSREQKQKVIEYRNYYVTHKK